jgi:hypothetical protein
MYRYDGILLSVVSYSFPHECIRKFLAAQYHMYVRLFLYPVRICVYMPSPICSCDCAVVHLSDICPTIASYYPHAVTDFVSLHSIDRIGRVGFMGGGAHPQGRGTEGGRIALGENRLPNARLPGCTGCRDRGRREGSAYLMPQNAPIVIPIPMKSPVSDLQPRQGEWGHPN